MKSRILGICLAIIALLSSCVNKQDTALPPTIESAAHASPLPSDTSALASPTHTPIPATPLPPIETPPPTKNILYVPQGNSLQVLDVTLPTNSDGSFPVILALHGGGGNKSEFYTWAKHFAELGYATVSINYRGMPGKDMSPQKSIYPASVQDTFCALAWIYANADTYGFDTQRVASLGFSLGGTLTAMLGTVDDPTPYLQGCPYSLPDGQKLQGAITFSGGFDYTLPMQPELEEYYTAYLGADLKTNPRLWADASPVTWVNGNEPPFLLLQGRSDEWIDADQPQTFVAAIQKVNESAELQFLPGDHMSIIKNADAFKIVDDFLKKLFE
jgi:pectinesterase